MMRGCGREKSGVGSARPIDTFRRVGVEGLAAVRPLYRIGAHGSCSAIEPPAARAPVSLLSRVGRTETIKILAAIGHYWPVSSTTPTPVLLEITFVCFILSATGLVCLM